MMKFCSTCRLYSRVCKTYFRSENYSECFRRNQRCDVRVIENEWKKLKIEKFKLRQEIRDALAVQKEICKVEDKVVSERRVTLIKKMRLRQQMNLLEERADEVIILKKNANCWRGFARELWFRELDVVFTSRFSYLKCARRAS